MLHSIPSHQFRGQGCTRMQRPSFVPPSSQSSGLWWAKNSQSSPSLLCVTETSRVVKGDAHLHKCFWQKREQESEIGLEEKRGQNWTADLSCSQSTRAHVRHLVSYAETLAGSPAECWLLSLNVICLSLSFSRTQKAELWLGAAYPSSHPKYKDEPLRQDISSHPRAPQVGVK